MLYKSNLTLPDMSGFKLSAQVLQNCGHDIPSDPDFDPGCGFMSHDEIAILYATLHGPHLHMKTAVEIGARFGWTAKAIHAATSGCVVCIDPILMYGNPELERFTENLGATFGSVIPVPRTAKEALRDLIGSKYAAFVIDGDHDEPQPLYDAVNCYRIAQPDCIMVLHDGRGKPIQDAVVWLLDQGFKSKFYYTPAGMFVCWRGFEGWEPPVHQPDLHINWDGVISQIAADSQRLWLHPRAQFVQYFEAAK